MFERMVLKNTIRLDFIVKSSELVPKSCYLQDAGAVMKTHERNPVADSLQAGQVEDIVKLAVDNRKQGYPMGLEDICLARDLAVRFSDCECIPLIIPCREMAKSRKYARALGSITTRDNIGVQNRDVDDLAGSSNSIEIVIFLQVEGQHLFDKAYHQTQLNGVGKKRNYSQPAEVISYR